MKAIKSMPTSKQTLSLLVMTGTLLLGNTAFAKGTVVGKVGTLGGGLEYVYPISPKFAVGVGINGFSISDNLNESDINYDADLKMQNFSIIGDFHPYKNGFRLSAGLTHNGNEFSLSAKPTGTETVNINGTNYTAADGIESLNGAIDFKSIAPYLGVGWGHAPNSRKGWSFDADLGVLFQGSPNSSLSITCTNPGSQACTDLEAEVAEEEKSFKTDTDDFDLYPVISIGASYTF